MKRRFVASFFMVRYNGGMIDRTFLHLSGVGPVTESRLQALGLEDWDAVLARPEIVPLGAKRLGRLIAELRACREALQQNDIRFLCETLVKKEQWRILAQYGDRVSYFDVETSDFSFDAHITVIVCLHRGQLHKFVWGENLDDFLDLLEEVDLLASFNGTTFDVPQLLRTWHIPELPCPHIDLRWQCYHCGWRGGLKEIERQIGLRRPADLEGIDGIDAVWFWRRWTHYREDASLRKLIRYCAVDVLTLPLIVRAILSQKSSSVAQDTTEDWWKTLDGL